VTAVSPSMWKMITVEDDHAPWNSGTYTFCGKDGQLSIKPVDATAANGSISIAGLSALVFSGTDPDTFVYRGWGSFDSETRAAMRAMFPPAWPHLHEIF
jgi:hypothetical protein